MVLGSISQVTFLYVCLSFTKLEILQTFCFWYTCWWDSGSQKQEQSSLISQMLQQFMTMWNRFDIHENILSLTHVPKPITIWDFLSAYNQLPGNSIWNEKRGLRATHSAGDSFSIICILWQGQHGEHRVRAYLHLNVLFVYPAVVRQLSYLNYNDLDQITPAFHLVAFSTGMSCCTNSLNRIYSPPASCHFCLLPLQERGNCRIKAKCKSKIYD